MFKEMHCMWTSVTFLLGQILIFLGSESIEKIEATLTTGMLQLGRRSAQKHQPGSLMEH